MKSLEERMKGYEGVSKQFLMRRTPVIVRVDGRAFHTWAKRLDHGRSFGLHECLTKAAYHLGSIMQGFKAAYIQSDEISFLLTDFERLGTEPWFGNNLQKLVSVTASGVTGLFNRFIYEQFGADVDLASFDARAFSVPVEEVSNYFLWRAQDNRRNAIQSIGQEFFGPKELHGKDRFDVMQMLEKKGVPFHTFPDWFINGTLLVKEKKDEAAATKCSKRHMFYRDRVPIYSAFSMLIEPLLVAEE